MLIFSLAGLGSFFDTYVDTPLLLCAAAVVIALFTPCVRVWFSASDSISSIVLWPVSKEAPLSIG